VDISASEPAVAKDEPLKQSNSNLELTSKPIPLWGELRTVTLEYYLEHRCKQSLTAYGLNKAISTDVRMMTCITLAFQLNAKRGIRSSAIPSMKKESRATHVKRYLHQYSGYHHLKRKQRVLIA
jgi:hypothetical protein